MRSRAASGGIGPSAGPVFFVDRSIGRHVVADALRAAGAAAEIHGDYFDQDTKDPLWITEVGRRGWFVLSKDGRIKSRTLERNAVREAGVGLFVLVTADLKGDQMAGAFVAALPRMARFSRKHERPFIAKVYRDSSVEMWEDFRPAER
ncbi:MAG: hypothetical protein FJ125_13255 [Deltaproteobacteria bacterium]|nr:hypothetical protein [Deltaproteobacteria bacterium]